MGLGSVSGVPGSGVRVRRCSQKLTTASSLMATRTQPRRTTVVKQSMDLLELLRKRGMDGDVDFLREALRVLVDGIMDAEVSAYRAIVPRQAGDDWAIGAAAGGVGADHRAGLLAALLRLADPWADAGGHHRRTGSGVGLLRRGAQVSGHRQLPASGGGTRPAASALHQRLPGILAAPRFHRRCGAGAETQGQAQGGAWRAVREGAFLQGRRFPPRACPT